MGGPTEPNRSSPIEAAAAAQSGADQPHRRGNALTDDWVLVSAGRSGRPWLGQVEPTPSQGVALYDPGCHLCPGNERASGIRDPRYEGTVHHAPVVA